MLHMPSSDTSLGKLEPFAYISKVKWIYSSKQFGTSDIYSHTELRSDVRSPLL